MTFEDTQSKLSPPIARKPRIEIGGGLYHVITRGNDRRKIFRTHDDYLRFTTILAQQKAKLPFYLYAYCLMPNHVHLLIEMRDDPLSRIMQRVLTSYSQYHNRKYKKIGHLFQGRYKSILCQTESIKSGLTPPFCFCGSGAFKGAQDHLPFGEDAGTSGTSEKHRFTNYELDAESNSDYAINRQYDIGAGRFKRPDPMHGFIRDPQSFNRYAYVNNEPVSFIDPLGLDKKNEGKCFDEKGQEVPCPNWDDYPGSDDPIQISVTEWLSNPYVPDWSRGGLSLFIDGGFGIIGGTTQAVTRALNAIKKKICDTIPSGRTVGVSGGLGAVGSVTGGGEIVINYNSGQVSAFGFGGTQAGWNGVASASVYSGHVWGLDDSNSNYSGGFSGFNASIPVGGVVGPGVFGAASSDGLTGGAKGLVSLKRPVVLGGSLGAAALGKYSFGGTAVHYTKPLPLGKYWPLALNPGDALLFAARQLCK